MPLGSPSARYCPRGSRWHRSRRCRSNTSGSVKTRGSWLAAAAERRTSAPSGSSRPKRSTSCRVNRSAETTGGRWRRVSSTAAFTNSGSPRSSTISSGSVSSRHQRLASTPCSVSWSISSTVTARSAPEPPRRPTIDSRSSPSPLPRCSSNGAAQTARRSSASRPSCLDDGSQLAARRSCRYARARSAVGSTAIAAHSSSNGRRANTSVARSRSVSCRSRRAIASPRSSATRSRQRRTSSSAPRSRPHPARPHRWARDRVSKLASSTNTLVTSSYRVTQKAFPGQSR